MRERAKGYPVRNCVQVPFWLLFYGSGIAPNLSASEESEHCRFDEQMMKCYSILRLVPGEFVIAWCF